MLRVIFRLLTTAALVLAAAASAPAASAATSTTSEYEAQIASLINSARASAGLPALTVSTSMSSVSRAWSQNMASTGAFTHNPDYSSQIPAGSTGSAENVAYGAVSSGQYSAISVHAALMASLGHRTDILDPETTHVGVGVAFVSRDGYNWVYLTENFATYPADSTSTPDPTTLDPTSDQIVPTPQNGHSTPKKPSHHGKPVR
jgi:uncharacterized protein YkwD